MPRISCIIPVFNCEAYIERALDSVLGQTTPVDEIIVVDDGSTDDTPQILHRYADSASVIRQSNAGPAAARNRGIEASSGDLLCFQDADDEWLPGKIARQISHLAENTQADACITHIRNIWDESQEAERESLKDHRSAQDPPGYVFQTLLAHRHAFERAGLLDESLRTAEDVEWYARARDAGLNIEVVPEVLVYRYLHGENTSTQKGITASERHDDLLEMMAARLKAAGATGPDQGKP